MLFCFGLPAQFDNAGLADEDRLAFLGGGLIKVAIRVHIRVLGVCGFRVLRGFLQGPHDGVLYGFLQLLSFEKYPEGLQGCKSLRGPGFGGSGIQEPWISFEFYTKGSIEVL